jgi:twitching motility protein PilT
MDKKIVNVRGRATSVLDMLSGMAALKASDLFLKTGSPVRFKISGRVVTFESDKLTKDTMAHVLQCFLVAEDRQRFHTKLVADVVFATEKARYRVHFAYGHTGPYCAIRMIGNDVLPFSALGLPKAATDPMLELRSGLLVVCGTTDAGKTVTCTSYLDHLNKTRELAILTLEDPIEYLLDDDRSFVVQREVGLHVPAFAEGVKAALRESLNVIFVGEMRDLDTIEQVLRAAEMGHLVVSTLHADDALGAIARLVGSFPPEQQPRIRQGLANVLNGIVFQRLLPTVSGGRAPAVETMWPNTAVRTILRSGDLGKLGTYVGSPTGGIRYQDSLGALLRDGKITRDTHDAEIARLRQGG